MATVELKAVSKIYPGGVRAVDSIDLTITHEWTRQCIKTAGHAERAGHSHCCSQEESSRGDCRQFFYTSNQFCFHINLTYSDCFKCQAC